MARRSHGDGTIVKTEFGRWRAQWWTPDGRRRSKNFETKGDAAAFLANQRSDAQRGNRLDEDGGREFLESYAERWLRVHTCEPTTRAKYRYLLDKHILPDIGRKQLNQLLPADIRAWYEPKKRRYKTAGDDAYRLLRAIMNTALEDRLIARSPCNIKGAGQVKATSRPTLTLDEIRAGVDAVQPHERAIVMLAVFGHLRRAELAGLRRRDVDLQRGEIHISETRPMAASETVVKAPKSDAGERTIALPKIAMDELRAHLTAFTPDDPDARVFSSDGIPLSPRTVTRVWARVRDQIGRPDVRLHDLRHTGLTLAARAGATTAELMLRGGHSTPSAALRYQQASRERDRALADALDQLAGSKASLGTDVEASVSTDTD